MGKCECHGNTEAPCWCENCCQQMSDDACAKETARADAAEAKLARAEESVRAIAAKDCTLCPFLGKGDPAVDESAAKLAEERKAHAELRDAVEHLCNVANNTGARLFTKTVHGVEYATHSDAFLALLRSVKR